MRGYYGDWLRTHQLVLDAMPDAVRRAGRGAAAQPRTAPPLPGPVRRRARRRSTPRGPCSPGSDICRARRSPRWGPGPCTGSSTTWTPRSESFVDGVARVRRGGRPARRSGRPQRDRLGVAGAEATPRPRRGWLDSALALSRDVGDRHREAQVRRRIAVLHELRGEPHVAQAELERALRIFDDLTDTHCAAYVQQSIGELCLRQGDAGPGVGAAGRRARRSAAAR